MATESVTVDNPYGIGALWAQGDFVAKGVMVLLVLMSAYSWFIIFTKWWEQRRLLSQAQEAEKKARAEDIKDIYAEAKGTGFDVQIMRKIVALRAKDAEKVAVEEAIMDLYKQALGM